MRSKLATRWMRHAAVTMAMMLALPAFADIKAFNAAITQGDFKGAAIAASETWPGLDKARPDIDVIAREFGFAAFMAGDYPAAQTYARAAVDHFAQPGATQTMLDTSTMLLRMSEHRAAPTPATRDHLAEALATRLARPGFDNISLRGADTLVAYDMQQGLWDKTAPDSALAIRLADAGGPTLIPARRTFELYAAIAGYMQNMTAEQYQPFLALRGEIVADIGATQSDEAAKAYTNVYWSTQAWEETLRNHQAGRGHVLPRPGRVPLSDAGQARLNRIAGSIDSSPGCEREMMERTKPNYPGSALYKGFVGTVIVRLDVDGDGRASNPELLASVPEASFGEAVLKGVPKMHFAPGKTWDKARCTMASSRQVVSFPFIIKK